MVRTAKLIPIKPTCVKFCCGSAFIGIRTWSLWKRWRRLVAVFFNSDSVFSDSVLCRRKASLSFSPLFLPHPCQKPRCITPPSSFRRSSEFNSQQFPGGSPPPPAPPPRSLNIPDSSLYISSVWNVLFFPSFYFLPLPYSLPSFFKFTTLFLFVDSKQFFLFLYLGIWAQINKPAYCFCSSWERY